MRLIKNSSINIFYIYYQIYKIFDNKVIILSVPKVMADIYTPTFT